VDTLYQFIDDTITINGTQYFTINNDVISFPTWIATNEADGLILSDISTDSSEIVNPLFFKYPAEDGEIYNYQIPNTDSIIIFEVVRINLKIEDNIYECYGYYNHNLHSYFPFMYFCPGIGMVRHKLVYYNDIIQSDTSNTRIWDLNSYSLVN
jgi:hypothetical protein